MRWTFCGTLLFPSFRGIEQVLVYMETHHWIFGFLVIGYVFYLHDRALHARFDALDKRIDEIRKRLAVEY